MKKFVQVLFVSFFIFNNCHAQWSTVNVGTTQDLYSVNHYNNSDIWIGSFNQVVKSANGGSIWSIVNPIKDPSNVQILPANMNDLALTGSNSAIGTGLFFTGNNECILTTTNGGTNWTIATNNSTAPLLRYINTVDLNGVNVVAVGNTGRMFTSSNSGASWTFITSGTTKRLNDVKFASADTVFSVGEGVIMKSVNRGTTWTANNTYTTSLNQVSCVKSTIYIGTTYNNQLLKSTDYGSTYSVINLPFVSTGVIYAVSKDTILAAGNTGLYVSKNGGQYWEKYNLAGYQQVKMIDRLPSNQLYAVGNTGYVIKAGNIATAPSLAITSFSIQGGSTSFCLGDSVILNNYTSPVAGYAYQWKLDGTSFSTQYNCGKKLTAAGNHTLSLDVTNSFGTSSYSVQIYVTGHDLNAFSMVSSNDTLCVGGIAGFSVLNTQSGTNYLLRNGFANVGAVKPGDGSTQEFIATAINSTTTYNIKATRNNGCFVDSLVQSKTIIVNTNPKATAGSYTPSVNYCGSNPGYIPGITNVTFNTLNNNTSYVTSNYFDYSCCRGTAVTMGNAYTFSITTAYVNGEYVKVWIDYNNNGTFEIPAEVAFSGFANHTTGGLITIGNTMFFNQKLRMRVASDISSSNMTNATNDFYCGQIEDYYLTIVPAPVLPTASFNKTISPGCLSTVTFTNTSYNASSYTWDFGDGSAVATTSNTSHSYGISGTYIASLTACNPTGCHTGTQSIVVAIPQVPIPAYCTPINDASGQYVGGMGSFRIDSTGDVNQYFWDAPPYYDATCYNTLYLRESKLYNIKIFGTPFHNLGRLTLSIDFDNNGIFDNNDYVWEAGSSGSYPYYPTGGNSFGPFKTIIPPTAVRNTPLRMRVIIDDPSHYSNYFNGGCPTSGGLAGTYHDYTVIIKDPLHVIPDFTESKDTVCSSSNQYIQFYNQTQNGSKFYWDFGDGSTSTDFNPGHLYTTPGTYSVKLKATSSMYADSVIKTNLITVLPGLPTPTITVNGSVLSTASAAPGYQWYRNYVAIPGATTSSYTATQDGDYVVKLINSNGCNAPSDVFEYYPVHLSLSFSADTICVGEYVFANHTRDNATLLSLTWGEGVNDLLNWNGLGGPYHIYAAPGTYTVFYKGCGDYNCDSLTKTIVVVPGQDTAVIVLNNGVLSTTTSAVSYQWYVDNNLIPAATSQSYTPIQDGYYQVKLTNAGGCNSLSNYYIHYPIHFAFTADTLGYCGVTSAEVQFYNSTTNATGYLWDFGDGNTSSVIHPSHTYNAPGIYTVKLKATSTYATDSLIKNSYITVTSTPFMPIIAASGTVQVCYGDTITISCTNVPGGRYQWYDGPGTLWWDTLSTYKATYASNFYMLATNSIGCSAFSNTIIPSIDNECVWPGDADYSYSVDNYDLLPIGLFYGETGAARSYTSNAWSQNPSQSWGLAPSYLTWLDKKHIDCNGDGIINDDDTLAIAMNFNLNHAKPAPSTNAPQSSLTIPQLYFTTSNTTFSAGEWVDVYINLGDATTPCVDMYGLLYNVAYDSYLVEPGTMSITYPNSWINAGSTPSLSLTKVDHVNGEIYTAVTKTNHQNASGYGAIAKMRFRVSTMLTSDDYIIFYFGDKEMIDNMGNYVPFYYGPDLGLDVTVLPTKLNELTTNTSFQVSPNPHTDKAEIKFNLKASSNVTVSLMNTLGEAIYTVVNGPMDAGKHKFTLNTNDLKLAAGIYYIKMDVDGKSTSHKIIKLD